MIAMMNLNCVCCMSSASESRTRTRDEINGALQEPLHKESELFDRDTIDYFKQTESIITRCYDNE